MTTTAQKIADILGNDGQNFRAPTGMSLEDLCWDHDAAKATRGHADEKYAFEDGSIIVILGGTCWDVGYQRCWCMASSPDQECLDHAYVETCADCGHETYRAPDYHPDRDAPTRDELSSEALDHPEHCDWRALTLGEV